MRAGWRRSAAVAQPFRIESPAHEVFIRCASRDKPTADAVCALLEARGIRCWIAPRDILSGRNRAEAIIDAIGSARVMVLIFSARDAAHFRVRRSGVSHDDTPLRLHALHPTRAVPQRWE